MLLAVLGSSMAYKFRLIPVDEFAVPYKELLFDTPSDGACELDDNKLFEILRSPRSLRAAERYSVCICRSFSILDQSIIDLS